MSKTVYLTTAIPYLNGAPHAGHALDYLQADVYKRYLEQRGISVRLQAGTDEHGNKIWKKAQSLDLPVEKYLLNASETFHGFIFTLNVEPTDFVRTTDPDHVYRCQMIWNRLAPFIYSDSYEGWYCSGCERFVSDSEYKDNSGICPDHKTPYERLSEKNYYFKLHKFKDRIRSAIESGEMKILPAFRAKEILNLLDASPDVSISRPVENLPWGIPVPDDPSQIMYVWIDALTNYLTVLGYPETEDISDTWPADVQFLGKDILRFHAIIWPALLLALNLPLPKILLSHGHVLNHGQKMSKSLGNVIDPQDVINKHGTDPFRYYFLRHIDTFADSDYTDEAFEAAYAGELANDLGNLVSRLNTLCWKKSVSFSPDDLEEIISCADHDQDFSQLMESLEFAKAFDYVWAKVKALNKQIETEKPWSLADADAAASLHSLASELLCINRLLYPFLPDTSLAIESAFASSEVIPIAPLFPKFPKK